MCKDQPAQIDCRIGKCIFNIEGGYCDNISPAITLTDPNTFVCWSNEFKEKDSVKLNYFHRVIKAILNKGNGHD